VLVLELRGLEFMKEVFDRFFIFYLLWLEEKSVAEVGNIQD
jgi:hypothetical protein